MPRGSKRTSPLLAVEIPENTKKVSFILKESTIRSIEEYREFLRAHQGHEISSEAVIDALAKTLEKDSLFASWRRERDQPSLGDAKLHPTKKK